MERREKITDRMPMHLFKDMPACDREIDLTKPVDTADAVPASI